MDFIEELINTFVKYDLDIDHSKAEKFYAYYKMILEYNEKVNLTAITEQSDFILKHLVDSVLCIDEFPRNCSLIDIGAGAGFPSIPIKIMRPDIKVTMIDGLNKRVTFLNSAIEKLELSDIKAYHGRCEDFAHNSEFREGFDYCVARAVASLATLCEYCLPFVKVYGYFIAFKSKNVNSEIELAKKAMDTLGGNLNNIKIFEIDELNAERDFLFIQKKFKTPIAYPRGQNKPKLHPL